jgi:hypothetical protein
MTESMVSLETVIARLECQNRRLERQNRSLKWIAAFVAVVLGATGFLWADRGSAQGTHDKSSQFVVYDDNGRARARLAMIKEGPGLQFLDEQGNVRMLLGLNDGGLIIRLWNERARLQSGLSVASEGISTFCLDRNGRVLVGLNAIKNKAGLAYPQEGTKLAPPGR